MEFYVPFGQHKRGKARGRQNFDALCRTPTALKDMAAERRYQCRGARQILAGWSRREKVGGLRGSKDEEHREHYQYMQAPNPPLTQPRAVKTAWRAWKVQERTGISRSTLLAGKERGEEVVSRPCTLSRKYTGEPIDHVTDRVPGEERVRSLHARLPDDAVGLREHFIRGANDF
jgi:hypothetical protein